MGTQVSAVYSRQTLTREQNHRLSQGHMRVLCSFYWEKLGAEYCTGSNDEPPASAKLGPSSDASSPTPATVSTFARNRPIMCQRSSLGFQCQGSGRQEWSQAKSCKASNCNCGQQKRFTGRPTAGTHGRRTKIGRAIQLQFHRSQSLGGYFQQQQDFNLTAGVLITGWDFVTEGLCRAAIVLCPVFYVGDKVILYLFLTVHQASAFSARRNYTACSRPCAAQYVSAPSKVRVLAARVENWTNPTTRRGERAAASEHRRGVC